MSERYHWLDKIVQSANDSNTAIYTMDPRASSAGPRTCCGRSRRTPAANVPEQRAGGVAAADRQGGERVLPAWIRATGKPADGKFHRHQGR